MSEKFIYWEGILKNIWKYETCENSYNNSCFALNLYLLDILFHTKIGENYADEDEPEKLSRIIVGDINKQSSIMNDAYYWLYNLTSVWLFFL